MPHFVVLSECTAEAPLDRWGPEVRHHRVFAPDGVNLDLAQVDAVEGILLRTWERGVEGETLACGSGAVAAAFAVRLQGLPEARQVIPASGIALEVRLPGPPDDPREAVVTGDARFVFEGELNEEATRGFSSR